MRKKEMENRIARLERKVRPVNHTWTVLTSTGVGVQVEAATVYTDNSGQMNYLVFIGADGNEVAIFKDYCYATKGAAISTS